MKRNIWITVMYDGSSFAGFQRQENGLAVQEVLEQVIARVTGEKSTLYFVARTDAGVHAYGQECTFYTSSSIRGEKFQAALNAYLPLSIRVRQSREMEEDFSVRRRNTGKTYGYLLSSSREVNPFLRRYMWNTGRTLDLAKMQDAAKVLVGTHNFSAFRGSNSVPADPVRRIVDITIRQDGDFYFLYVTGEGFLYHMVRNIAGAMADAGTGKKTAEDLQRILLSRDRRQLGITAPASGLCLLKVYFEPISAACIGETLAEALWPWAGW